MRRSSVLLSILFMLAISQIALGQLPTGAALSPVGSPPQMSTKGIVTAKGERSIAIRESSGLLHIVVTPQTQVTGLRTAFGEIAVSDIVRAEGQPASTPRVMTAHRVDVLFASEATARARAKPLHRLFEWIKNGGVTIDLP